VAISDRTRRKGTAAAQKLLEPGTEIRAYSVGVTGPYPLYTVLGVLGLAVAIYASLALLFGMVLGPGGVLLAVIGYSINGPRAVVVADKGVALLRRSLWTSKPDRVLALLPPGVVSHAVAEKRGPRVRIELGPEHVWMHEREHRRLLAAAAGIPTSWA
jgi:hypothetical protein